MRWAVKYCPVGATNLTNAPTSMYWRLELIGASPGPKLIKVPPVLSIILPVLPLVMSLTWFHVTTPPLLVSG